MGDEERHRQCETGFVRIHRDDPRAEVILMTDFGGNVPNVQYGISGLDFDLMAQDERKRSGYSGYGYEPNSVGVYVRATPTSSAITFDAVNLGFGDSDLLSVKVSYQ